MINGNLKRTGGHMFRAGHPSLRFRSVGIASSVLAAMMAVDALPTLAQNRIQPVTDAELSDPSPDDWLMWRRTLDGWGYSPLDQVNRENVSNLQMIWSRGLQPGRQQGTPLVRDGVMFMPNPRDIIQALDAETGDLIWEHQRDRPDDLGDYMMAGGLNETNRNIAIHGELIINTSMDDHIFALHAETGEVVWDTEILDYRVNPANQTSGPIVAGGKVFSGRSCDPRGGPNGCVITAHDAVTGEELWRRRLIPAPGEPGDETWGDVPFEERAHVGSWMVPSYDPALNLVYVGTSVTSPAPKFMLGGTDKTHLYHNSTLALNGDTGEIVWHYQHLNDSWDLDHPFERLLVDTVVRPDPSTVSWINPRLNPGEQLRVVTGIPGKTGIVYTLDRETGEFLWATPTIVQNVISGIDGATGAVSENAELVFTAAGQTVLACPHASGGKDWEAGAYSPRTNTMYMPLRNVCARMRAMSEPDEQDEARRLYALAWRPEIAPGTDQVGSVQAISAETGQVVWNYQQRAATMALAATGGGLVFGGDVNGRFRAFDDRTGEILWEINLGSPVSGFPVTYAVDGRQYVAISTGYGRFLELTPELRPSFGNSLFIFALPE
ncbi:MAG: ATP-binding protein [Acidobacteria bacterium]|nr:ATP-binding protein [Acidobacteriota bacterium]